MKKGILIGIMASLLASGVAWPQGPERTTKMYQLKWRNARDIAGLLGGLGCCFSVSDGFNTISATTDSTGHTLLKNLIEKYDVPARTVEFQFYLIKATAGVEGLKDGLPDKIKKVINEVAALTRFKSFELLDSPVVRASEGKRDRYLRKRHVFLQPRAGWARSVDRDHR